MVTFKQYPLVLLFIQIILCVLVYGNPSVVLKRSNNDNSFDNTLFDVDLTLFKDNGTPITEFTVTYRTEPSYIGDKPYIVCNDDQSKNSITIENIVRGTSVSVKVSPNVTTFPLHLLFFKDMTSPDNSVVIVFVPKGTNENIEFSLPKLVYREFSFVNPQVMVLPSYTYESKTYPLSTLSDRLSVPTGGSFSWDLNISGESFNMLKSNTIAEVKFEIDFTQFPGITAGAISIELQPGMSSVCNDLHCIHPGTYVISPYHASICKLVVSTDNANYSLFHQKSDNPTNISLAIKISNGPSLTQPVWLPLHFLTHPVDIMSALSVVTFDNNIPRYELGIINAIAATSLVELVFPSKVDISDNGSCQVQSFTEPATTITFKTDIHGNCLMYLVPAEPFPLGKSAFTMTSSLPTSLQNSITGYLGPSLSLAQVPGSPGKAKFSIDIGGLINAGTSLSKFSLALIHSELILSEHLSQCTFGSDPDIPLTLSHLSEGTILNVEVDPVFDAKYVSLRLSLELEFVDAPLEDLSVVLYTSLTNTLASTPLPAFTVEPIDVSVTVDLTSIVFTNNEGTFPITADPIPIFHSGGSFVLEFSPSLTSGTVLPYSVRVWVALDHITGLLDQTISITDLSTGDLLPSNPLSIKPCPHKSDSMCAIVDIVDMTDLSDLKISVTLTVDKYLYDNYDNSSFFFTYYYDLLDSTDIPIVIHKNVDLTGFQYPPLLAHIKPISNEPVPLVDSEIQITDVVKSKSRAAVRYAIVLTALPETPLVAYLSTPFGLSPNSLSTQIVEQVGCSGFKLTMDSELRMIKGVLNQRVEGNNEMMECQLIIEELLNYSDVGGQFPSDAMNTLNSDPVTHSYNQNYVFKYLSELNLNVFLDVEDAKDSTSVITHSVSGLSAFTLKAEYLDQRELVLSRFTLELNLAPKEKIQIKNNDYLKYDFPLSTDILSHAGLTLSSTSHTVTIENPSGSFYGSGTYMVHVHIPSTVVTDTVSISIDYDGNDMLMLSRTKSSSAEISFKVPNRPKPLTPDELEEILKVTEDNIYRDKETGGDGGSHVIDIEQSVDSEVDTDVNVDVIWTPGSDEDASKMDDLDSLLDKDSFVDSLNNKGFDVDKKDVQVKEKEMSDVCENVCGRLGCKRCVVGDKCTAHTECMTGICKDGFCVKKPEEEKEENNNAYLIYSKNLVSVMAILLIFLQ